MRLSIGLWFIISSYGKLLDINVFRNGVLKYKIIPVYLVSPIAYMLPWIELVFSLLLILGIALPIVASFLVMLLLVFIIAIAINLKRGRYIDCNCHGIFSTHTINRGTIIRNLVLIIWCFPLIILSPSRFNLSLWHKDIALIGTVWDLLLTLLLVSFAILIPVLLEWHFSLNDYVTNMKAKI